MLKAYKYRIYPNKEQMEQIAKTFGCTRFVYNYMLAYRKEKSVGEKKSLSRIDCNNFCNRILKKEFTWLNEVDKFALTNAIYNMDAAFQKFYKEHTGYPNFKCKRSGRKSYKTNYSNGNIRVDFERGRIKLPKMQELRVKFHRTFTGQIKSVTVTQEESGKYYISVLVQTEHAQIPHTDQCIGLDLRNKETCVTSNGETYGYLNLLKTYEKRMMRLQKQLARKTRGSKNYHKIRRQMAVCWEKACNAKKDYLHKLSHKMISENQVIVLEEQQVKSIAPPRKFVFRLSWYELIRQLDYKASWNDRRCIKIKSSRIPLKTAADILAAGLDQIA